MSDNTQDDRQVLEQLNIDIGDWENAGNKDELDKHLADKLAFLKADKDRTITDLQGFRDGVKSAEAEGKPKRTTEIESIAFYGKRAVVTCVVTRGEGRFHNVRLFVKRNGDWKLLGWANEPLPYDKAN